MADAAARAALEATQMELRALKEELAKRPAVSPEREALEAEVLALEQDVDRTTALIPSLNRREAAARDLITRRGGDKWWVSPYAAFAMALSVVPAFWLAVRSFDFVDWTYWGPRAAPVLLAVAPVVNGARCVRSWLRRAARSGRA